MRTRLVVFFGTLAVLSLPLASAQATPINGSIDVTPLIVSVSSGSDDVLGANGFNLSFTLTGSAAGDFSGFSPGTSVTVNDPFTFSPSTAISAFYSFSNGSEDAVFDVATSTVTARHVTASGGTIDIFSTGTLKLTGFDDMFASMNFSATKSGSTWSASSTVFAPGRTTESLPEPMTLAFFGAALAGLGILRRRKA